MIRQEQMLVISRREIADHIVELRLQGALAAQVTEPGQFVHIRPKGDLRGQMTLLRRPISICRTDRENKLLTLIFRWGGAGTEVLAQTQPGETMDVLGPLGHGFPVEKTAPGGTALLIGGGVGVPPLYGLSADLRRKGRSVVHLLGFRSAKDIFYEEEFKSLGETILFTEDGSKGKKGLVTDQLQNVPFDTAYACGPLPMLRAVQTMLKGKALYLSLEQRMGCGIGACLACVVPVADPEDRKGYRRVCCDGPVFPAGEVKLC